MTAPRGGHDIIAAEPCEMFSQSPANERSPALCHWTCRLERRGWVLPDGCEDLLVRIEPRGKTRVFLSRLDRTARVIHTSGETVFVGVRLRPGTRLQLPGWEPPLGTSPLIPPEAGDAALRSWLGAVRLRPERAPELLVQALDRWAKPAPLHARDFLVGLLREQAARPRSSSARTLRRHIGHALGAPPTFWRGLLRARRALRRIVLTPQPIVGVALDEGYADQAHLTREFRVWFGLTPGRARAEREELALAVDSQDAFSR